MYTLFSRIALNDQNVKNALDYAEKYCCSFHLSLLRCKDIIDRYVVFTDSVLDEDEMSVSDVIPISGEEYIMLLNSMAKLQGMNFVYEKIPGIVQDLVNAYYNKTHDDTFLSAYKAYHYIYTENGVHEKIRREYVDSDFALPAAALAKSVYEELDTDDSFFTEESFDFVENYINAHEAEIVRKEISRIMNSSLDDWKKVIQEYI